RQEAMRFLERELGSRRMPLVEALLDDARERGRLAQLAEERLLRARDAASEAAERVLVVPEDLVGEELGRGAVDRLEVVEEGHRAGRARGGGRGLAAGPRRAGSEGLEGGRRPGGGAGEERGAGPGRAPGAGTRESRDEPRLRRARTAAPLERHDVPDQLAR